MQRRDFIHKSLLGSIMATIPFSLGFQSLTMMKPVKKIIKPARLRKGDTIGLIVPASPVAEIKIKTAIQNLESQGFKVKYTDAITANYGHLAGSDSRRIYDLHEMFRDKTVKAIWAIRGGYGCTRIIDKLDYELIRKNPKILIGYSDITALLNAIYQKTGLICFHGPVGATPFTPYNVENLQNVLMNPVASLSIKNAAVNLEKTEQGYAPVIINGGKANGKLIGGNLCLLAAMAGTPFQVDLKNKLVFMEDVGEKPYRIDRMLTQLLHSSNLAQAKGIILGVFEDCQPKDEQYSLSLIDTLKDRLGNLNIPVLYGFSFGHIQNMCTFPVGINASFDADAMTVTLEETAVM
jgi:muramoyltetrapeptide carboxypeptidase